MARPRVGIEVVERSDLRLGTVVRAGAVEGGGDLAVVEVRLDRTVSCLVAAASLPEPVVGARVIVARGLHRIVVGGTAYRDTLLTEGGGSGRLLLVESEAPDGARLY